MYNFGENVEIDVFILKKLIAIEKLSLEWSELYINNSIITISA